MRYHYTSIRIAKIKLRVTSPNTGEDMDKPDHSYIVAENINGTTTLENNLETSYKIKHFPYDSAIALLGSPQNWWENLCLHKSLHMNVSSGFIHESGSSQDIPQ